MLGVGSLLLPAAKLAKGRSLPPLALFISQTLVQPFVLILGSEKY
jgi:hypothetical protein